MSISLLALVMGSLAAYAILIIRCLTVIKRETRKMIVNITKARAVEILDQYTLFCITADYRPHNEHKPHYYVLAGSKVQAKRRFSQRISWLKIYDCEPVEHEKAEYILMNREHYIVF